jgi:hypothetical protein
MTGNLLVANVIAALTASLTASFRKTNALPKKGGEHALTCGSSSSDSVQRESTLLRSIDSFPGDTLCSYHTPLYSLVVLKILSMNYT